MLRTADGRRVALELELTPKSRTRLETILAGYGADPRFAGVVYLVERPSVARSVQAAARRLGIAPLVHVQPRAVDRVEERHRARRQRRALGDEPRAAPAPRRRPDEAAEANAPLCAATWCSRRSSRSSCCPPAWRCRQLGAMLAVSAIRGARSIAGRRAGRRREGEIVLGVDKRGRLVRLGDDELSAHGLILGASGAGKSTTLLTILTDQVRRGRPVVAIDMKGSPAFARVLAEAAAAAGRPFKVWTLDGGAHWNPLAHGNATELKDKLIATERFTEPHYQRAAERYIQTVLQVLAAGPSRPAADAARGRGADGSAPAGDPRSEPSTGRSANGCRITSPALTHDQLSAVRGLADAAGGAHRVAHRSVPRRRRPTPGAHAIDLRAALSGPEVVVFSLNSSRYGKLAAQIGTLAVQDLVAASGDRLLEPSSGRSIEQAVIGIDEFSALGSDHVVALLARGRESGMPRARRHPGARRPRAGRAEASRTRCSASPRSRSSTARRCPSSALTIAQIAGTEEVWEETRQIGGRLLGGYGTGRGTRRLGRAVHRPPQRDQDAADRRGGGDLEDPGRQAADRADHAAAAAGRTRARPLTARAAAIGGRAGTDYAHEPERRRRRAPRSSGARRRRRTTTSPSPTS